MSDKTKEDTGIKLTDWLDIRLKKTGKPIAETAIPEMMKEILASGHNVILTDTNGRPYRLLGHTKDGWTIGEYDESILKRKASIGKAPFKTHGMTLRETAEVLAQAHREIDLKTREIYLIPSPTGDEIRLIEITESVPSSGGAMPFGFPPAKDQGINFRSNVILLSKEEWEKVLNQEIELPSGWDISKKDAL